MHAPLFRKGVINIMKFNERVEIVEKVLALLKSKKLNKKEKNQIYKIVMKINNKTDKQKDRFTKFYDLQPLQKKHYTLSEIAKQYGCTISAINYSIISIRSALFRVSEDEILILKKIVETN